MNNHSTLPALLLLSAALAPAVPAIALIENPEPIVTTHPVTLPLATAEEHGQHRLMAIARSAFHWSSERVRFLHRKAAMDHTHRDSGESTPA